MFVKVYDEERDHGGIDGHTPSAMFLSKGRLNNSSNNKKIKQIKILPKLVSEFVT